ncbi:VWA domain-containing protein [Hoeflea sp. CAU 1731]
MTPPADSDLPRAAAPFLGFARLLRRHGFVASSEQATTFMQAIALLGPRSVDHIREAALATLAPRPDRRDEFDVLYRMWLHGEEQVPHDGEGEDEETGVKENGPGLEHVAPEQGEAGGKHASAKERLARREFSDRVDSLQTFQRHIAQALPKRRTFRTEVATSPGALDLRRSLRSFVQTGGDIPSPVWRKRREEPRRLLLLIDVSGSMKQFTPGYLEMAHAAVHGATRVEVFTFGTRLTRLTAALRVRDRSMALARAASLVDDWDGGTRIGPSLLAYLSIPRFAALANGACVVILSDGLERGDPAPMELAISRLRGRARRLTFVTPLAGDPRFSPETAAMKAILPMLDDLIDGSSVASVTDFLLSLARPAPAAKSIWQRAS